MEPVGPDNLRPVFITRNVRDSGYSIIVKEQHVKFSLKQDNIIFGGIGFGMSGKFPMMENNKVIDIVFTLDENEWNGNKQLQMKVIDIRSSE